MCNIWFIVAKFNGFFARLIKIGRPGDYIYNITLVRLEKGLIFYLKVDERAFSHRGG